MFAIQEDISLAIVNALKVNLLKEEKATIEKRLTDNTESYDLYLIGRHFTETLQFPQAHDYFLNAIEKDSTFAAAYA